MPAVNLLIKPASSACNMNCAYCFYKDVAKNRAVAFEGMMTPDTLECVIRAGLEYAEKLCTFAFQGGEPTLAGLDFYRQAIALQKKYARPDVKICNAIQTNGYAIDEEWARFFADNHFLVGLSLDGPADLHNLNRVDTKGKGTFNRVLRTASLLKRFGVEYNILCVVTGRNARSAEKIYHFFAKQNFDWLQFIPCLEPLEAQRGEAAFHLSAKEYGDFLVRIFDLWAADLQKGKYVSIRHLDNWMGIFLGARPEACSMTGRCSVQFVVEGDGGVYPCDFYVLDQWRLGTVGQNSLAEMESCDTAKRFVEASVRVPEECSSCEIFTICRNGCRRDRILLEDGSIDRNCYCEAYRQFFAQRGQALRRAAAMLAGR